MKIRIVDWQDRDFVVVLDAGLASALCDGLDADCVAVADRVQAELRQDGFSKARITYDRSVDGALAQVAHWPVWRDGHGIGTSV